MTTPRHGIDADDDVIYYRRIFLIILTKYIANVSIIDVHYIIFYFTIEMDFVWFTEILLVKKKTSLL